MDYVDPSHLKRQMDFEALAFGNAAKLKPRQFFNCKITHLKQTSKFE